MTRPTQATDKSHRPVIRFLLSFFLVSGACADPLFEQAKAKAEIGNAVAQNTLGFLYFEGKVVKQDYPQALKWFNKAAERGNVKAQYNLAIIHELGQGAPRDDAQVIEWYTRAAAQGDPVAQVNLAFIYYHGQGVSKDYEQAFKWYSRAAEQGVAEAQQKIGIMYELGQGVPVSIKNAHEWYVKATANEKIVSRDETYVLTASVLQGAQMRESKAAVTAIP